MTTKAHRALRYATSLMLFLLACPLAHAQQLPAEVTQLFDYDARQSLDVQSKVLLEKDGATLYDISYASPKGGRVNAYLVVPKGKGPFAGILFGHWGQGNRTEFLPEAFLYARAGAVSLLPDYPWDRPVPSRKPLQFVGNPENDRDIYIQAVVDLRRGMDLLQSRSDVDAKRIAYVGHSFGAQWGSILSAVDRRMKTSILMGGVPDSDAIFKESDSPEIAELRKSAPERVEQYLTVMRVVDASGYAAAAAPIPLFFQFARFEQFFGEPAMRRYFKAASEPKVEKWYDTGHDLNDPQALADRAAWLRKHIGIASVQLLKSSE